MISARCAPPAGCREAGCEKSRKRVEIFPPHPVGLGSEASKDGHWLGIRPACRLPLHHYLGGH